MTSVAEHACLPSTLPSMHSVLSTACLAFFHALLQVPVMSGCTAVGVRADTCQPCPGPVLRALSCVPSVLNALNSRKVHTVLVRWTVRHSLCQLGSSCRKIGLRGMKTAFSKKPGMVEASKQLVLCAGLWLYSMSHKPL